jgi:hypothetical protein
MEENIAYWKDLRKELVQTAAMAIRQLVEMEED